VHAAFPDLILKLPERDTSTTRSYETSLLFSNLYSGTQLEMYAGITRKRKRDRREANGVTNTSGTGIFLNLL